MVDEATYDAIGRNYARYRQPDPRIAAQIESALGKAELVLNVGAGTGSYEAADRRVVAVEPSAVMLAQRSAVSCRQSGLMPTPSRSPTLLSMPLWLFSRCTTGPMSPPVLPNSGGLLKGS